MVMNLLDMMILAVMLFLLIRGVMRGFFREIGSLAGVILGIWLGNVFQPQMTEILRPYFPSMPFLPLLSFSLIFGAVLVFCNLAGYALRLISKKVLLGWADRTLGAGLALLKGIIITYLAILLLTFFVPAKSPLVARSKMAPLIISSYQSMVSLISPDFYQSWKRKFLGKSEKKDEAASRSLQRHAGKDGLR